MAPFLPSPVFSTETGFFAAVRGLGFEIDLDADFAAF
jgi:hypothetical protein